MLIKTMLIETMLIQKMLIQIMLIQIMMIEIMLIKIIFDRTGVLIMLSTPLAGDRTGVRSVAGSDFIYNATKNSARPRFDFNMCTICASCRLVDYFSTVSEWLRLHFD